MFAALLALDSPYDICYKKIPFLSASEIATQPEKLMPKRCATQRYKINNMYLLTNFSTTVFSGTVLQTVKVVNP